MINNVVNHYFVKQLVARSFEQPIADTIIAPEPGRSSFYFF